MSSVNLSWAILVPAGIGIAKYVDGYTAINKYIRMGNQYPLNHLEMPSNERMLEIARKLEIYNLEVKIGG